MRNCITLFILAAVVAVAATRVYDVELSQNDNATTPEDGWVGQTFIATCDSIQWAAFFVGRACTSGTYKTEIWDSTGLQSRYGGGEVSAVDPQYQYVNAIFEDTAAVIKGVKYMLKVSHSGGDSVNYYYNDNNPYAYGELVVGGQKSPGLDLAARVEGVNWVPKDFWGLQIQNWEFWGIDRKTEAVAESAKSNGVTMARECFWWHWFEPNKDQFETLTVDSFVRAYAERDIKILARLAFSSMWATSCDSESIHYNITPFPPICLDSPAVQNGTIFRNNYWGYYVYRFIRRYGPKKSGADSMNFWWQNSSVPYHPIVDYQIWNEPNAMGPGARDTSMHDSTGCGHWLRPEKYYTPPAASGASFEAYMCSLYVRLCKVARLAADEATEGCTESVRLYTCGTAKVFFKDTSKLVMKGIDFLDRYYQYSSGPDADGCDGIALHPYQNDSGALFSPTRFVRELDTVRAVMRKHGAGDRPLWPTELGWSVVDSVTPERQANNLLEFYVMFLGSALNPWGGYGPPFWYSFRNIGASSNGESNFGIRFRNLDKRPAAHSFRQMVSSLDSLLINRRVLIGDTMKSRIYELQDSTGKRTWVGWKNYKTDGSPIAVAMPTVTDSSYKTKIAYSASEETTIATAGTYGYTSVTLDTFPIYLRQPSTATSRPDMMVDSIWLSPNPPQVNNPITFFARLKNVGNAAKQSFEPPANDSICFYVNGDKKSDTLIGASVAPGDTVTVHGRLTWTPADTGNYLVRAIVNGSKVFMELSFDNNAKYRMYNISYLPPTGWVKVNGDEPFANTHFGVLDMKSYNPNKADSASADYMRITQYTVSGGETTEYSSLWVDFDPHYPWRLRQNQGRNVVYAQFKIDEGNLTSDVYKDSILVDWTYPETLKMVINHDSPFTSDTTCTLCCHAVDLSSGICQMRFGNDSLVNLVREGDMSSSSRWLWNHAVYHDSLDLFEMEIQDDTNYLYQQIPKDSILAKDPNCYNGDTLQISGDLVLDHFKGSGRLEARLIFVPDQPQAETLGTVPYGASIALPETTISKTGRYNLYSYFKFKPESTGYDFQRVDIGIFVTNSTSDTGRIYVDNIRLEPVKPKHTYSPFVSFDTTKLWSLNPVNGRQVVFAQYQDSAGNETHVTWDTVVLDTTSPVCAITIPSDSQMVSSTLSIYGYANDQSDTGQYFWKYNLDYRPDGSETWYPVKPDWVSYSPVYYMPPGSWLGDWWTDSVPNHHHYDLRVQVRDSAGNQAESTVYGVYVSNADPPGGDGDGFGGFGGEAEAMSLDKDDNLYLTSTESPADQIDLRVRKYSPTGESLLAFSAKLPTDSTKNPWPSAIVVDDSLRILVLDGLNNCLKVFDKTGKLLVKIGSRGSGQGQFLNPSDIKWDSPGKTKLFFADKGNKRVQVLTKQGSFLRQFGTDSIPLNNPIALVHNSYNQACVLDVQNDTGKLFVFDSTGKIKKVVTSFSLKNPTALSLDSKNNLFIADAGNKRILELSASLTHIYSFGTEGDSFGQFRNPTALSITKDSRYLYVYDRGKRTISKFTMIKSKKRSGGGGQSEELLEILPTQLLLYAPKPNPAKRIVMLKYAVPRQEKISLVIYDIVGRQARTITDKIHKPGFYTQTWDGKDARGRELSAGIYFCLLKDDEKILTKKVVLVK